MLEATVDANRENIERAAREHWVNDDKVFKFFQTFVSKTPHELRELLDDPMFNTGFVTGLAYVRSLRARGPKPKNGDIKILARVIEAAIEATKHTPFISKN